MPSHYDKGDYDSRDAGGGARYSRGRGRGRGNYAWGGRVGNSSSSGGGRGYGRGGASGGSSGSGGSRYRGGGGHGVASSSYRDNTSYHDRYSESRRSGGHMVNPWDAGMGPREVGGGGGYGAHASAFGATGMGMGSSGGSGGGAGTSQLIGSLNQLSQMGNDKSKLALNILNAVLSSDNAMGEGRDAWEHGPPPRKMRRMEWDELRPPPARRYPPRYSPRRTWDRRGGPSYPRGDHHSGSTDYQARRVAKARRGKPWHDTRSGKGPGREGRAKEEQDLSDDLERESTTAAAGTSAAQAPQSSEDKMEEDEGKEETEASSQGKAEGKAEGEDKEAKEGEEGAAAGKSDDKEGKKDTDMVKQNEAGEITWLPREALQCHMCGLSKFPDIKSYMRHLESRRHETLKYSFHAKGAAILHFLRANSKLASQRKMLKSLRRGIKGPIMRCRKCQCEVFGYIREHAKTVEHIALRNYLRVVCCNTTFFNRADLEEHRLSLTHLKNQLEEGQKMEAESEVEDIGVEESGNSLPALTEEGKLFADTIKHMKQKTKFSEVTSPENLMPYDPATPQGLNFIWKRSHYRCKACPQVRLASAADTEEHFKSLDHYNNLMAHLKAIEQEKEKKRLEEEEAARKAEIERKKKEEAEAKAAEEGKGGEGEEDKEEKEAEGKEKGDQEAEKEENEDSKKNGDMEGEEDEDLEEEEEEEEATAAARTGEEEEEEEEEDTSFNFEEDMHNMETVDEACDDGEIEGGLEGSLAEEGVGKEDSVGGVTTEALFADISCLSEVGEELDDEVMEKIEPKEEKVEVKAEAEEVKVETKPVVEEVKAKAKPKAAVKKEAEEPVESVKKEAVKREREEDEEPAATVAVEAKGRGRGAATPRGRRGRGRGRARSAKN
ncbi:zinc finger protein on ecdysone puffs-like isoform X3 [Eriocheir sinensis]|uniref:zinc finger protein on ecdysone puffs-like isoform X3 n=1 Tax=Eriocheir sinensis TaxID=95602 RepID=UPI0021CA0687|nr:zinc finger protein on ecdysone puffs-like isoform X3 [Eriocheir sinensis]